MGYLAAQDMVSLASLDQALRWHLQSNHYPPVPLTMMGPCKRAIMYVRRGEQHMVRLPKGVTYKGRTMAPAWAVVDAHHLEAFI